MSAPTTEELLAACENMDWQQVVQNGGPPCFALRDGDGKFCGRAQRWQGHPSDHSFVSLRDLFAKATGGAR